MSTMDSMQCRIGITIINEEHDKLLKITAYIISTFDKSSLPASEVSQLLATELYDVSARYFKNEERLFQLYEMPFYTQHRDEHGVYLSDLSKAIHLASDTNDPLLPTDISIVFNERLVAHIDHYDKIMAEFISAKQPRI